MPKTNTVVSIFLSSPGDVAAERDIVDRVIEELNKTWSKINGVRIDVIRWERDSRPGFGVDAQAVLNTQLPSDYDIFIGILWGRIGTPTARSISGTVEEFELAFERFRLNPGSVQLMIYFKDTPISPSEIDPSQIAAVREFQKKISQLGGLYKPFKDSASFEALVRHDVSVEVNRIASAFNSGLVSAPHTSSDSTVGSPLIGHVSEEDYGIFDYKSQFNVAVKELVECLESISNAAIVLTEETLSHTAKIISVNQSGADNDEENIAILRQMAGVLDGFTTTLQSKIDRMADLRNRAFNSMSKLGVLLDQFTSGPSQKAELAISLHQLANNAEGSLESFKSLRNNLHGLQSMTKDLNVARRMAIVQIDNLISEISSTAAGAADLGNIFNAG